MSHTKLICDNFFSPKRRNTKLLLQMKGKVDLILTDPPYNIGDKGKVTKMKGKLWSNAEAWGDHFQDDFTEESYDQFIKDFLGRSFLLLKEGGSLVTFIDDKYAGVLIRLAEQINLEKHLKDMEESKKPPQPTGFAFKRNIHFIKVNAVPRIRAFNYTTACEVAVWFVKPRLRGSSKTKPEIFNYMKPQKNLRIYDKEGKDAGLDVRKYHNTFSSNVFFYNIGSKHTDHPCEKYEAMLEPLVRAHSNKGSLVFDPFFGGGNSALVCRKLRRDYVGFDIDRHWHEKACGFLRKQIAEEE